VLFLRELYLKQQYVRNLLRGASRSRKMFSETVIETVYL